MKNVKYISTLDWEIMIEKCMEDAKNVIALERLAGYEPGEALLSYSENNAESYLLSLGYKKKLT